MNPEFVERDGMQLEEEGCLSSAWIHRNRGAAARVRSQGPRTVMAWSLSVEGTGLLARAFQHEMDHLDGTLFIDRLRGIQRDVIVRKIRKYEANGDWR